MNSSKASEKKIETQNLKDVFVKLAPLVTKENFYEKPTTESLAVFETFITEAKKIIDVQYGEFAKGNSKAYKSYLLTLVGLVQNIFFTLKELGYISSQRAILGDPTEEQIPVIKQVPTILQRIVYLIENPSKLPAAAEIRQKIRQDEQLTPLKEKVNSILEPKFNAQRIKKGEAGIKLEWHLLIGNIEQDFMLVMQNHKLEFKKDDLSKWQQKFQSFLPEFQVQFLPTADGQTWRLALVDIYNRRTMVLKLNEELNRTRARCTFFIDRLFGGNLTTEQLNALQEGVSQGMKENIDETLIKLNQQPRVNGKK